MPVDLIRSRKEYMALVSWLLLGVGSLPGRIMMVMTGSPLQCCW